ncbi:MAG TPA: anti-sigma factor [Solirubrobacteraceae bacterium]
MEDSKPGKHDCGADAAAYVLGALEPNEAEAFSRHLDTCIVCRDEVTAFQQVADTLAMTPAQHRAPHGLKRRVMREVRDSEPEAKGVTARRPGWLGSGVWLPRPALATMAALAIAVVVVGVIALSSGGSSASRVISASVTGSPGTAQLSVSGGRAQLIVRHFPQPSAGHIYEVWKLKRGARTPTPTSALFSVNSSGAGDVGVPGDLDGVSQVLVTQEPAGGSTVPTRAPVIVASLA